jgi:hypothetical protein
MDYHFGHSKGQRSQKHDKRPSQHCCDCSVISSLKFIDSIITSNNEEV